MDDNYYSVTINQDNSDELICVICGDQAIDHGGLCQRCLDDEINSADQNEHI